ncbi:hypothetical protein [Anaerosalibacter sp. Marseille-P3206]|uniref:hypothetical protein n=1 Tax=Anaerosalibacter sp. Marseille-P3206 TaxID=1871005 RepID=UPI000985B701|nr:hypothetical protein [Anaerosalibacter sp. Marseille-P3206]
MDKYIVSLESGWTDIVAAVVVIYSAVLSTITFIRQCMREKPIGKLEFGFINIIGMMQGHKMVEENEFEINPSITFNNKGVNKIKVTNIGIKLPNDMNIYFLNKYVQMPQIVEPGNSFTTWTVGDKLVEELRKNDYNGEKTLRCFATDAVGNKYHSKKFKINLEQKFR